MGAEPTWCEPESGHLTAITWYPGAGKPVQNVAGEHLISWGKGRQGNLTLGPQANIA